MVKREVQYAKIASKHGVTASYVRQIDTGDRQANSDLSKAIAQDLQKFNLEVERFEKRVA